MALEGDKVSEPATIDAVIKGSKSVPDLRYLLTFAASGQRTEVIDEAI